LVSGKSHHIKNIIINFPIFFVPGWRCESHLDRGSNQLPSQRRMDAHAAAEARSTSQVLSLLSGPALPRNLHHSSNPEKNTLLHVSWSRISLKGKNKVKNYFSSQNLHILDFFLFECKVSLSFWSTFFFSYLSVSLFIFLSIYLSIFFVFLLFSTYVCVQNSFLFVSQIKII
jgi:hypothetical protein